MISFSTPWNDQTYKDIIYRVILPLEEKGGTPSPNVYIDSKGYATIGAGFLVRTQAESILKTLFLRFQISDDPNPAQINAIKAAVTENGVDKKFASDTAAQTAINTALKTALQTALNDTTKTFTFANNDEVKSTFYLIDKQFEDQLNSYWSSPVVPKSRERVALLSLAYNAVLAQSPTLIKDVGTLNDRADAWYQIRYDSNGGASQSVGIAKRRFYESSLFGLSADLNAPTLAEAQQAYSMFNKRHSEILAYEKHWGQLPDGQRAINKDKNGRTGIEAATQDYSGILKDANLSATNPATLDNQLNPLKNKLLDTLRAQLTPEEAAALPANGAVKATSLYVATPDAAGKDVAVTLDAGAFESYYGKDGSNDLLIGAGLADVLKNARPFREGLQKSAH